jgi:hypothetical protein
MDRRIEFQGQPRGKNVDPIQKITKAKMPEGAKLKW